VLQSVLCAYVQKIGISALELNTVNEFGKLRAGCGYRSAIVSVQMNAYRLLVFGGFEEAHFFSVEFKNTLESSLCFLGLLFNKQAYLGGGVSLGEHFGLFLGGS
jgi:hypothetical protein